MTQYVDVSHNHVHAIVDNMAGTFVGDFLKRDTSYDNLLATGIFLNGDTFFDIFVSAGDFFYGDAFFDAFGIFGDVLIGGTFDASGAIEIFL